MLNDKLEKHLDGVDQARRDVINKLVVGSAFVPPVVVAFGMSSAAKAAGDVGAFGPNQI